MAANDNTMSSSISDEETMAIAAPSAAASQHQEGRVLPPLTSGPTLYPGCCLALSTHLVKHIRALLPPPPALTLSIGSGFGLLEALLLASPPPSLRLIGVEVQPSPNQYLDAAHHRTVQGTRFLEPLAAAATTWLFVYPRRVGLLREYMDAFGRDKVGHITWVGPQADWDVYRDCLVDWTVQVQSAGECGGRPWDVICSAQPRVS
ncbi:hypothetical protein BDU57DRAFT_514238 [Ampelomyces quisqualis]|uniref:S-adenosyl-L-methionine-dependent methyltransferase n=1 Tax=Ampelomyces quisqualis TaxID=50730 RepID=A0A6A5QQX2_AMPQU|nr:hypothetical protein BDU57DRAFT_514238 [Ampelomyces quisqualis]